MCDLYLDGVITVVDSKYGLQQLAETASDGSPCEASRCSSTVVIQNKKMRSQPRTQKRKKKSMKPPMATLSTSKALILGQCPIL
jgi:hypothetical protein